MNSWFWYEVSTTCYSFGACVTPSGTWTPRFSYHYFPRYDHRFCQWSPCRQGGGACMMDRFAVMVCRLSIFGRVTTLILMRSYPHLLFVTRLSLYYTLLYSECQHFLFVFLIFLYSSIPRARNNPPKTTKKRVNGIHMGAKTHHHDQVIWPVNFSAMNRRASAPRNPIPPLDRTVTLPLFVVIVCPLLNGACRRTRTHKPSGSKPDALSIELGKHYLAHHTGNDPVSQAWEACILPIDEWCLLVPEVGVEPTLYSFWICCLYRLRYTGFKSFLDDFIYVSSTSYTNLFIIESTYGYTFSHML